MSVTEINKKKTSFFKEHILPVIIVFLIPVFSIWFFGYAEKKMDADVLQQFEFDVRAESGLGDEERAKILVFQKQSPPSKVFASNRPEDAVWLELYEPLKTPYAVFRWMSRIAWICLGTIAATVLIVGLSVAYSLRSQSAQYYSLRIGWPVLRTTAAIQVLGQGILAVALSFWVTAVVAEVYFIKIVGVIGIMVFIGMISLWRAIFTKTPEIVCKVSGELITETSAPALWQRVRELAARLDTNPPDRIIVGVDPNFFVTEHPVTLAGETHQGRTLYLSLPLLKVLQTDEAEAIFGHELAHFSGQDTLWSRRISPLLSKFANYLNALVGGFTTMIANFMHFFWKGYELSISRLSRAREFRADQVGAQASSKFAMKRALVKTTCYCEYRAKTENAVLERRSVDRGLNLALQLEQGYPAFLNSFTANHEAINERIPHPFDSHPTLHSRMENLGFAPIDALADPEILRPAQSSWYSAIAEAPAMEERMWTEQQEELQTVHEQALALTVMPKTDEEASAVVQNYPRATFRDSGGKEAVLEFDRIQIPEWPIPIFFRDIVIVITDDGFRGLLLCITHTVPDTERSVETKTYAMKFKGERGDLLSAFEQYYGRHQIAAQLEKA